jgi:LCP family protein required for cell wall assembly
MSSRRKKKPSRILRIVLAALSVIVTACVIFSAVIIVAFYTRLSEPLSELGRQITGLQSSGITDTFTPVPKITSVLLIGLDDDAESGAQLADFLMVLFYDSRTGAMDLISIPRDTRVTVPDDRFELFRWKPRSTTVKINGIINYAGNLENGTYLTVAQVDELLGISLDYYVRITLDGFRKLIDDVGGVHFDVPQRMYYTDPYQDLVIDLHPGPQRLMGRDAEGLLRYRRADQWNPLSPGYAMGDLQRVRVQQDFMVAAITQVLSSGRNIIPLAEMALNDVKTNANPVDIVRFAPEMGRVDFSRLTTHTLPGTATDYSPWFYLPDDDGIRNLIKQINNN